MKKILIKILIMFIYGFIGFFPLFIVMDVLMGIQLSNFSIITQLIFFFALAFYAEVYSQKLIPKWSENK